MKYKVFVLLEAEQDLFDIFGYVAVASSQARAESLLSRLQGACLSLSRFPERGRIPPEMRLLGISMYREILLSPFRIVYLIDGRRVQVYAVLGGRRDVSDILEDRLLR